MKAVHPSHLTTKQLHYHWYFRNRLGSDQFMGAEGAMACHLTAYEHHHVLLGQHHNTAAQTLPVPKASKPERLVCTSFIYLVRSLHWHMKAQNNAQPAAGCLCHSAFALMLQNHKSLEWQSNGFRTVSYRGSNWGTSSLIFLGSPSGTYRRGPVQKRTVLCLLTTAARLWVASRSSLIAHIWAGHHGL